MSQMPEYWDPKTRTWKIYYTEINRPAYQMDPDLNKQGMKVSPVLMLGIVGIAIGAGIVWVRSLKR